ncbi:MAG TPA: hypothetical protein VK756_10100 [Solirubrobacteraceae bacterium]|nr:hypothetical protein [Solirubrobacteraceae bacterium]
MDYQLTIEFAQLGHVPEMPDRLLTILLKRHADAGPALAHNQATGTLTVMLAFTASDPVGDVSSLSKALGEALRDAGLKDPPMILDAHLAAVHESEDDHVNAPRMLTPA